MQAVERVTAAGAPADPRSRRHGDNARGHDAVIAAVRGANV